MTTPYGFPGDPPDPRFSPTGGYPSRPGRYPIGYGSYPPPAPAPATKSSLPMVSFVCGLLSFLCVPVVLAIIAIVTGVMGRRRARAERNPTGFATAGLVLGMLNLVVSVIGILFAVSIGVGVVNQINEQLIVVRDLVPATAAASAFQAEKGTYTGLSTAALGRYGFTPSAGTTVIARSSRDGRTYCIQATAEADPGTVVHVPVTATDRATGAAADIGTDLATYARGPCAVR